MNSKEIKASDLKTWHRILILILISMGSSSIYMPAYLIYTFQDTLQKGLQLNAGQVGSLLGAYAIAATICYLPSGIIADKIRMKNLSWVGFVTTAVLVYWYAARPSYGVLYFIFIAMGVTTILIWWGVRYKTIRLISPEDGYAKNIGISYGVYGGAALIVGFINAGIVSSAANAGAGLTTLLIFLASLILVLGILSFFFIPKFEGEISKGEGGFDFSMIGKTLINPVVWLAAGTMFFVYFFYTNMFQTTGMLAIVATAAVMNIVNVIRTYGVTIFSGPIWGFLANAANSASKIVIWSGIAVVIGLVALALLPTTTATVVIVVIIALLLGLISNGVFGIVSGQLTEGKVPAALFGTASGILSVVGFLPDTFSQTWFGNIVTNAQAPYLDAKGAVKHGMDAAYHAATQGAYSQIFYYMAGAAVIAIIFAVALLAYVKAKKNKEDAAPATDSQLESAPVAA